MIKNFLAFVGGITLLLIGHKAYTKYMEEKVAKDMAESQVRADKLRRAREEAQRRDDASTGAAEAAA